MNAEGMQFPAMPGEPWSSDSSLRRAEALRSARRNSVRVRRLRLLLPSLLAVMITAIIAVKMLPTTLPLNADVSIGRISFDDGKLTMENARLTGHRKDSRSYEFIAAKAIQDPKDTSVIHLRKIDGKMTRDGGDTTTLTADEGIYYTEQEKADLSHNIVVTSKTHVVRLEQAQVDLQSGDVTSNVPVRIDMLNGTLNARSMSIREKGDIMYFKDQVRLVFVPEKDEEKSDSEKP